MTQDMAVYAQQGGTLTRYAVPAEEMQLQVQQIQHVMKAVMKKNEHYGKIPGCGDKPALLKPGAEKLMMTFRLSNDTDIEVIELERGHREYRVKCTLFSPDGQRLGSGVGSCSTMEGKYRFRKAGYICPECGMEDTVIRGKAEYGGGYICFGKKGGCGAKFPDGDARIEGQQVGRAEYDNPADYYNTCLKMAKKRALVDATLTTTAASDIFTQDIDDMPEVFGGAVKLEQKPEPAPSAEQKNPKRARMKKESSIPEPPPMPEPPPIIEERAGVPTPDDEAEFMSLVKLAGPLMRDSEKAGMNAEYKRGYTDKGIRMGIMTLRAIIAERGSKQSAM